MALIRHNGIDKAPFKLAQEHLTPCEILVDVGCGLRPQNLVRCRRHICLEPHSEYADALEAAGYEVIRGTAKDLPACDTVVALDVIEHMERLEGESFIADALEKASQIVIFTPLGFMPQDEIGKTDSWGMNGQSWQRHRSGWTPEDFPGWLHLVFPTMNKGFGAFFAIYAANPSAGKTI